MVSKTATFAGWKQEWDHEAINSIIKGYHLLMVQKGPII